MSIIEDVPRATVSQRGIRAGVVRVLEVSDDGEVRAEVAGGVVQTFLVPLERVPAYRKLSAGAPGDAATS